MTASLPGSGVNTAKVGDMTRHASTTAPPLSRWQLALAAAAVTLTALILIAYGAAGSYESLWRYAAAHQVPLARLAPVGLDGGLIGVIVLDITFTWAGHPLGWLRLVARLFALATLAANAAAGWPDPAAVFLRVFAPLLIVVITEAVRGVLLARNGEARQPVPVARWLLAPRSTFRLWRRMVLWRVNDYAAAVDMEADRLRAIKSLTVKYGTGWESEAPADVVWMLTSGVKMADALAAAAELTAVTPPSPGSQPDGQAGRHEDGQGDSQRERQKAVSDRRQKAAKVKRILTANWDLPIAEVAARAGVSESTVTRIKRAMPTPIRSRAAAR